MLIDQGGAPVLGGDLIRPEYADDGVGLRPKLVPVRAGCLGRRLGLGGAGLLLGRHAICKRAGAAGGQVALGLNGGGSGAHICPLNIPHRWPLHHAAHRAGIISCALPQRHCLRGLLSMPQHHLDDDRRTRAVGQQSDDRLRVLRGRRGTPGPPMASAAVAESKIRILPTHALHYQRTLVGNLL